MGELFRRPADLRDGRKRLFWWCDNVIFDDGHAAHMGMAGFMVYCALARYADGHNRAMLTQKALIAATGMSRRGVQSALNSLLQSGYLGVEKKALAKGEENIYVLRDLADIVPPRLAHDVRRLEEEPAHLVRLTSAPRAPVLI